MSSNKMTNLKQKGDSMLSGCKKPPNKSKTEKSTPRLKKDNQNSSKLEVTTPATTSNRSLKLHNCLTTEVTPISKKSISNLKRKSISLIELNCNKNIWTPTKLNSNEHGDDIKIKNELKITNNLENEALLYFNNTKKTELAKNVYKMFILHAWRQRRVQVAALKKTMQKMENQVADLKIQNVCLRDLLVSEQLRVNVAISDSSHLKQRLESELETSIEQQKELNKLKSEKLEWDNMRPQLHSEINSLKNELTSANEIVGELKGGLEKSERNLSDLKTVESQLLSKVEVSESYLKEKNQNLNELTKQLTDCETQIKELISKKQQECEEKIKKEKELNECMKKIKKMGAEMNNQKNIRKDQNENILNLTKDIKILTEKIEDKEDLIHKLTGTINQYISEQEEFNNNLWKVRNCVIFDAIKKSVNIFVPKPPS